MGGPRELVKIEEISVDQMREEYRVESLSRTEKELRELKDKLTTTAKVGLVIAYEIGRRLAAVKKTLDHGQFLPWLEQNFGFTDRTAQRYIRIYDYFRDKPQQVLEELTLQEAYALAGVNRVMRKPPQESKVKIFHKPRDPEAERAKMVWIFEQPTVSGKLLKKHRVENINGSIYVYRKDVGATIHAADIYLPKPFGMPEIDWRDAMQSFVIAMELYLLKIEQYEEQGRISPPEDNRILSVVERIESTRSRRRRPEEEVG